MLYSASTGASTGQTPAHVPHPIHADSSITKHVSPCEMHPTGQLAAQAPQLIHLSLILYMEKSDYNIDQLCESLYKINNILINTEYIYNKCQNPIHLKIRKMR